MGGMAEVFLARQRGHGGFAKLVVVKRILPHLLPHAEFVDMFIGEARTAALLHHPNVVQIYEVGDDDGRPYMVMEYLDGCSLRQVQSALAEGKTQIPLVHACQIVVDAALGLHHAHTQKDLAGAAMELVHRDVSPQNLMVTFDGVTKVVDFGIAKANTQDTVTESGVIKGKFSYMSPEQAASLPLDGRSDQFSLGVVFWELLTMRRLFKRGSEIDTLRAIGEADAPYVSTFREGIPDTLDEIVATMLSKSPGDRYDSCAYVAQDIEAFLHEARLRGSPARTGTYIRGLFAEGGDDKTQTQTVPAVAASSSVPSPDTAVPAVIAEVQRPESGRRYLLIAAFVSLLVTALLVFFYVHNQPRGEVRVDTLPPAATVFVDGKNKGTTPLVLREISIGRDHRLRVERTGYAPEESRFRISEEKPSMELHFQLRRP